MAKHPSTQRTRKTGSSRSRASVLRESDQIVHAIRGGKIDGFVTSGARGDEVLILQGAEHPYRVLVEAVNDGAATIDLSGTILYANPRFAEILDVSVDALVGTSLREHVSPPEFDRLQALLSETEETGEKRETVLEEIDGKRRIVRFVLCPASPSDSNGVCIIATELTELHKANQALINNEESLRQLSARLLQLQDEERRHIARDLHDITGQKLALQSLELSQVLKENGHRIPAKYRRMLTECASLSKEVSGEIRTLSYLLHPPLLDELGLPAAVRWYTEGFQKRTGIATEVDVSRDLPRLAPDVEMSLFRVVQESLTNVHRYSGSPRVLIRIQRVDCEMRLEVRDFGKGMCADAPSSSPANVASLGVGIQGMHERMRQLSGRLEVSSQPDAGTSVLATIPIQRALAQAEPAIATEETSAVSLEEVRDAARVGGGARKRILIADDHEMLRHGVRSLLEMRTDWEICGEAVNGKDAVEKAEGLKPDLIILDMNMPELNGLEAARRILRSVPVTKILVFTVHDSDQATQEVLASGAHAYLSKSRAGQDLLRTVQDLLEENPPVMAANASSGA